MSGGCRAVAIRRLRNCDDRCPSLASLLLIAGVPAVRSDDDRVPAREQSQQAGRVRWPDCRSAAIAGDGRLDALADPRLASKRLADLRRDP